jgi:4-alpha-glucanotransferase
MAPEFNSDLVEFDLIKKWRLGLMAKAAKSFRNNRSKLQFKQFLDYCNQNESWLQNYSVFNVLEKIHNSENWINWNSNYKTFSKDLLSQIQESHSQELDDIKILQYLFDCQWAELKSYANLKGIQIIGDIPIYVSFNSADVWANQSLFKLSNNGNMTVQSGCPPDFFIESGQNWGHPIYDWVEHRKNNFEWWTSRITHLFQRVDIVRIDHFNGFVKFWEIPAEDDNGNRGYWVKGPGRTLFNAITNQIGRKPILAENLGEASKDADVLREKFGIPGMKILQMSFGNGHPFDPMSEDTVVYTGTHDNDTSIGWYNAEFENGSTQSEQEFLNERQHAKNVLNLDGHDVNWKMVEFTLNANANTSIIPMQDVLGLDSSARMNTPGTVGGNWEWRMSPGMLTQEIKQHLRQLTEKSNRT